MAARAPSRMGHSLRCSVVFASEKNVANGGGNADHEVTASPLKQPKMIVRHYDFRLSNSSALSDTVTGKSDRFYALYAEKWKLMIFRHATSIHLA